MYLRSARFPKRSGVITFRRPFLCTLNMCLHQQRCIYKIYKQKSKTIYKYIFALYVLQSITVGTVCPFASNISIYFIQYFILIFVLQSFQDSISFKFKIKLLTIFLYDYFKIFYKGVDFNI